MAKLGTPEQMLGGLPAIRSGTPVVRYDESAVGGGLANLGADLFRASAALKANWDTINTAAVDSRFQQWKFDEAKRYDAAVRAMKPGEAAGFAENYSKGYFERAKAFKSTVPGELKDDYDAKLFSYEQAVYADSLEFERAEQKRFAINTLDDSVKNVFLPKVNMAAELPPGDPKKATVLAEAEREALAAIDANPGLTPIEKDEQRRKVRAVLQTEFAKALPPEEKIFVDPSYPKETIGERVRAIESGGNPSASNPDSSAYGADQFTAGTWLGLVKKYRPDLARDRTDKQILMLRGLPAISAEMRDLYMEENARFLGARGHGATPGNLYLAHFLGPGGAAAMLGADPNISAADINPAAAKANPKVFYRNGDPTQPLSAGEIVAWASGRMAGAKHTDWGRRLDAIPYDQKVAIALDGGAALVALDTARKQAEQAAYDAQLNAAKNAILDGKFGLADVLAAYDNGNGWLKNPDDRKAITEMIVSRDRDALKTAAAANKINDRTYKFNQFSKDDTDAVDQYYGNVGGDLLTEPDKAAFLTSIVRRTEHVPKGAVETIKAGVWGKAGAERDAAFTILDGLYNMNPPAVERTFDEDTISRLQTYRALAPTLTPEELAKRLDPMVNPDEAKRRETLRDAGRKEAGKIETDEIIGYFDESWMPFSGPGASPDAGVVQALRDDFEALFAERYSITGNVDVAKTQAIERLKNSGKWGTTEVGTGRYVTSYPPEMHYPTVDGSHDWMDADLQDTVKELEPKADDWTIITTPETEAAVQANRSGMSVPVPYGIMVEVGGVWKVLATRATFDHDRAMLDARKRFEDKRKAASVAAGGVAEENARRAAMGLPPLPGPEPAAGDVDAMRESLDKFNTPPPVAPPAPTLPESERRSGAGIAPLPGDLTLPAADDPNAAENARRNSMGMPPLSLPK